MKMKDASQIPYGIQDFARIRREGYYYVDKTAYVRTVEQAGSFLFFVRPRRFGKSLFLDMLRCYYDVNEKKNFKKYFGDLDIGRRPTANRNRYQVLTLDFSKAGAVGDESLAVSFDRYLGEKLNGFLDAYAKSYGDAFVRRVLPLSPLEKFTAISTKAKKAGWPIYLIVDEYDNFTNAMIRETGKDAYRKITHGTGFYREWFKKFKGEVDRIFMAGVSPVTMDDLTSGFNIATNITGRDEFNAALGFSERECVKMYSDFKGAGRFKSGDPAEIVRSIKPWYDGYCFAEGKLGEESVFNSDMALYHLRSLVECGRPPKNMVDRNIATDYDKLQTIADLQRQCGAKDAEDVLPIVDTLENGDAVTFDLVESFPAEAIAKTENFRSLFFYYGIVSMSHREKGKVAYRIPNHCIRHQVFEYLRNTYHKTREPDWIGWGDLASAFAYDGEWKPFVKELAKNYAMTSPIRAGIGGEIRVQGYLQAEFGHLKFYLACPEMELAGGYGDFFLFPERVYYGDVRHSYIVEVKQAKRNATAAATAKLAREAAAQLKRYAQDKTVPTLAKGTVLHCLAIVFKGKKLVTARQVLERNFG